MRTSGDPGMPMPASPSRLQLTDGDIWEIFLNGDDPDLLWNRVKPLLASPQLWRNAEVSKLGESGSSRFRLGPSDF